MAKLTNGSALWWSPPGTEELPDGERPAFSFRAPTVYDRSRLGAACLARGVRSRTAAEIRALMRDGVAEILPDPADPDRVRLLELLALDPTPPERETELSDLSQILHRHWPAYAQAVADNIEWSAVLRLEAFRLHCVGWRNVAVNGVAVPFKKSHGGVDDHVLSALPDEVRDAAAAYALGLFAPSETERKNSSSPSPTPSTGEPSTAASTPPSNGL